MQVFDADGSLAFNFLAYRCGYTGGVRVATGDIGNDGVLDIITAKGVGGASRIKVFSGVDASKIHSFFAFGAKFEKGVYIASGDIDHDDTDDIVASKGRNRRAAS